MCWPCSPTCAGSSGSRTEAAREAGHSALTVIVCVILWAFTTHGGGYFWPGWVILAAVLSFVTRVGKAALGDAKEGEKLEKRYGSRR